MANTHSIDLEAGSSHYLSAPDSASLSITGDISLECWVKIESAPSVGGTYHMITKYRTDNDQRSYSFTYRNVGGTLTLRMTISSDGGSGGNTIDHDEAVDLGTGIWHHVAVTVDFTNNEVKFYVDGAQEGTTKTESTINSIFNSTARFAIGAVYVGESSLLLFFDGLIDEVRVWNDVRTSTEIADNYDTELVGNEAGLAAYFKLNDSLLDETANNNDLDNPNSASFSTDVPFSGAASGPANLKTLNGLAKASVKTIDGLAIASVKTFNGLN